MTRREQELVYPIVIILVDRIKCQAYLDTGTESFYILSEFARSLSYNSHICRDIQSADDQRRRQFYHKRRSHQSQPTEFDRSSKPLLQRCYQKYSHLKQTQTNDSNERTKLPIYVISGVSDCAQIKTKQNVRMGNRG